MLAPLSWLKEYVSLPALTDLVDRLNETGTTVASVTTFGEGLEGTLVGEILDVNPHPNADKLQLTTVALPGKKLSIVCGAPNIAAGQKVPVAPIGSSVPVGREGTPMKIEKVKIRDVESQGMLCSAKELGLGDDHGGILILDDTLKIGTKLTSALGLPETILDIEVTTNRGDELSIYGLAREISVVTGSALKPLTGKKPSAPEKKSPLSIKVVNEALCPRYSAVKIGNLTVGPSPAFIQSRLRGAGMRPISNIVDITNYVMLLTGQPLHAFNAASVKGSSITVRESKAGERITTLDGVTRVLGFGQIVIAGSEKILALGGVMGGIGSGISNDTNEIIIESAIFDPVSIRQTVTKFNLRSEASLRYERGVDTEGTVRALEIAADLLARYAGGQIVSEIVDIYPASSQPSKVSLTKSKLGQYLGYDHSLKEAGKILGKLGLKQVSATKDKLTVMVPSWRDRDISLEVDLIEEVARIQGYSKIPSVMPVGTIPVTIPNQITTSLHQIREHLTSLGLNEVSVPPMVSSDQINGNQALKISNSISKDWDYLRVSIVPGLISTAAYNADLGNSSSIFEIGRVYQPRQGDLPVESTHLALTSNSFSDLKGYIESMLERLNLPPANFLPGTSPYMAEGTAATVVLNNTVIGVLGTVSPKFKDQAGLRRSLWVGEIDLSSLLTNLPGPATFSPVPKYPTSREDLSILVDVDVSADQIIKIASKAGGELLVHVELRDIFADPALGEGKKSVTITLTFQARDKTLTDLEIKEEKSKIELALKSKLQAKIR